MSKKEIYICDVCGKETEKTLGSTDRVFDDFTEEFPANVYGVKLELKQTEDVANACVCDDCFIEFLESALEQMREMQKEEHHQAETTLPLKSEVVTESLGEKLLMRYCKHELKPETRAVSICSIEAANKKLAKNSIPFEVFYLAGKTIMQKEYAITTIAGWVNKKAPKRNTKSCNAFVKKYPIVEFCKTMEDVRTWWNRFKEYSQKNPKCNVRKENNK